MSPGQSLEAVLHYSTVFDHKRWDIFTEPRIDFIRKIFFGISKSFIFKEFHGKIVKLSKLGIIIYYMGMTWELLNGNDLDISNLKSQHSYTRK